jgi:hypothetical protein
MNAEKHSDEEILHLVNKVDKELLLNGMDIKKRYWEVPRVVMQQLGYAPYAGRPAILHRIEAAFNSIYRKEDIAIGGHIGVFMYRDIFARIAVPAQVYGEVSINPLQSGQINACTARVHTDRTRRNAEVPRSVRGRVGYPALRQRIEAPI